MNKLILAGAAALAFAVPAVPAMAQDTTMPAATAAYTMSADQQTMYDAWPADRQTAFTAWPDTYKVYYWTLTPDQQNGWWVLTDGQRGRVYAMMPEQRTAAWTSIMAQMANAPSAMASDTAMAATTAAPMAGSPTFVSNAVTETTPAATPPSEYPLCSATVTDSCRNPREAGKNYGNRPLGYWPGKPASEIPGKKPAEGM